MSAGISRRLRNVLNTLLILTLSSVLFFLGFKTSDSGYYDEVMRPKLKEAVLPMINVFKTRPEEIIEVGLTIPDQQYDRIKEIRRQALEDGVFVDGKEQWFDAQMTWKDTTISVQLRLKGGLLDHLTSDRWSFRIRTDSSFQGLSRFSIQHPNTRNFVYEAILHQLAKQEGLTALRYGFAKIRINDSMGGLYAVEEHFSDELLANNGREPGPIVKFDDEGRIAWLAHEQKLAVDTVETVPNFYTQASIDVYQADEWAKNDSTRRILERAVDLLGGFRNGKYRTSTALDIDQLSSLFALADLLGAQHCTDWRNLRFHYDRKTDKLFPIVYDGNAGERISAIRALREQPALRFDSAAQDNFFERLFSDRKFYEAYMQALERYSGGTVMEEMFAKIEDDITAQMNLINVEFPNFRFDLVIFNDCRETIRYTIDPPTAIQVYLSNLEEKQLELEVRNNCGLPLELIKVRSGKNEWVSSEPYLLLAHEERPSPLQRLLFYPLGHRSNDVSEMEIHYRVVGTGRIRIEQVRPYSSGVSAVEK